MTVRRCYAVVPAAAIILTTLLVGACGKKQVSLGDMSQDGVETIEAIVDETISDPERAEQVRERLVRLDQLIEEYGTELRRIRTQVFYFNANYHTTTADYDRFRADLRRLRETKKNEFIALALDVRTVVTEEEWAVLHR